MPLKFSKRRALFWLREKILENYVVFSLKEVSNEFQLDGSTRLVYDFSS